MSLLSELKPNKGATKKERRVGRGDSSGWGGTAGKGHKGQKARSGAPIRRGFEGGQTPLVRRIPKFGFTNAAFRTRYEVVNLETLNKLDGEVTPESLRASGVLSGKNELVKILGRGELSKGLTVKAHKFSQSAKAAIEAAGGTAEVIK
jgi:large subunit ribosomal protein L15